MRRSRLSTIAIAVLQQEIQRRQKMLPRLIAQRDALNREIAELQGLAEPAVQKEAKPQAASKKARRRRARNKIGLADALSQFLKGKAKVTVGEAMEGVLAAGYRAPQNRPQVRPEGVIRQDRRVSTCQTNTISRSCGTWPPAWRRSPRCRCRRRSAALWRKLNGLKPERPMVMIDQVCWNEMNVDDELTLRCEDPECRGYEELAAPHALPVAALPGGHGGRAVRAGAQGDRQHRLRHRRQGARRGDRPHQRGRRARLRQPVRDRGRPGEDPDAA